MAKTKGTLELFTSLPALRADIQQMRDDGMRYWQIAEHYKVNRGIVWKILNVPDYKPSSPTLRTILGLPATVGVVPVNGTPIAPGSQALASRVCACGRSFIPNTAKRRACFVCTPYRRRK